MIQTFTKDHISVRLLLVWIILVLSFSSCSNDTEEPVPEQKEISILDDNQEISNSEAGEEKQDQGLYDNSSQSRFYNHAAPKSPLKIVWSFSADARIGTIPYFRDNVLYGGSYDFSLYAITVGRKTPKWIFPSKGIIASPPIRRDNLIFLASADGWFYALSEFTGEISWKYLLKGFCGDSAAFSKESVVLGTTEGQLYSLSALTGKPVWNKSFGNGITVGPVVSEDIIVVGMQNGTIRGHAAETGDERFFTPGIDDPVTGLSEYKNQVGVAWYSGKTALMNGQTGEVLWEKRFPEKNTFPPAMGKGVFISGGGEKIRALNSEQGSVLWEKDFNSQVIGTALLSNEAVYVSTRNNKLQCLDLQDGTLIWTLELPGIPSTAPLPAEEAVFLGTETGQFLCLGSEDFELPELEGGPEKPILTTKEAELPLSLGKEGTEVIFIPPETGTYLISFPEQNDNPVVLKIKDDRGNLLSSTLDKLGLDADISFRFLKDERYTLEIEPLREDEGVRTIRLSLELIMK